MKTLTIEKLILIRYEVAYTCIELNHHYNSLYMVPICCPYTKHRFRPVYNLFLCIAFEQNHTLRANLLQVRLFC